MTDHPDNRIPFPKPDGYDPGQYALLLRVFQAGWRETFDKFDAVPNRKTDSNNHGPFSTDNIGDNYDYPEASYERRRQILKDHETYQKGWLYFIANDPRVPAEVQQAMRRWGLPKDEFTDNGGWPHQIYVREARRMVGEFVMTQHQLQRTQPTPDPVGMGSYTIDSHNVQRYITPEGHVQNEGDIGVALDGPYAIAYGALAPEAGPGQQPPGPGVRVELAHRLRVDSHGAGVHDPRAVGRDGGGAGHRRRRGGSGRALRGAARTVVEGRAGARIAAAGQHGPTDRSRVSSAQRLFPPIEDDLMHALRLVRCLCLLFAFTLAAPVARPGADR